MKSYCKWILVCLATSLCVILVAHSGSKAVTVIAENMPVQRKHCIILDAGHGGIDGGAISCTGIPESKYNLEITNRLKDLFHLMGYETKMIRSEDISIHTKGETIAQKKVSDLKERIKITNETNNALLISIHQNSFHDGRYQGSQVFYSKTTGSQELAQELQDLFKTSIDPDNNRTVKEGSGIFLLERIEKPGILVECGFLSNPQDEANLRDPEYQKKICGVIISAVNSFLSNT